MSRVIVVVHLRGGPNDGASILVNPLNVAYVLPDGPGSEVYFTGMSPAPAGKLKIRETIQQLANRNNLTPPN